MRKLVAVLVVAAAAVVAAPAQAAHQHLHCLVTPNGESHFIARGVSLEANHTGFSNFHSNVHLALFVFGDHPLDIQAPIPLTATSCPD
jgi:hypothetical protein